MEEAEKWLIGQHKAYCSRRRSAEGDTSKRMVGAHNCLQTCSRYRGVVWRGNPAGWEISSRVQSTIARGR
jgi:hypothetical protein